MIQKAINHYKYGISHDIFKEPVTTYAKLAVKALEEMVERENQKPLTLEELRQMDGEPVWIAIIGKPDLDCWGYHDEDGVNGYTCFTQDDDYGETWVAYRHEPGKEQTNA